MNEPLRPRRTSGPRHPLICCTGSAGIEPHDVCPARKAGVIRPVSRTNIGVSSLFPGLLARVEPNAEMCSTKRERLRRGRDRCLQGHREVMVFSWRAGPRGGSGNNTRPYLRGERGPGKTNVRRQTGPCRRSRRYAKGHQGEADSLERNIERQKDAPIITIVSLDPVRPPSESHIPHHHDSLCTLISPSHVSVCRLGI